MPPDREMVFTLFLSMLLSDSWVQNIMRAEYYAIEQFFISDAMTWFQTPLFMCLGSEINSLVF